MPDPFPNADTTDRREGASEGVNAFPALSSVAVALRHDREAGTLPRIVASGRGSVAEQILKVALAEGIEIRQDADLAEVLAALEIGSDIPVEAFAAVAEILSYLYRANQIHAASRSDGPDNDATGPRKSDASVHSGSESPKPRSIKDSQP